MNDVSNLVEEELAKAYFQVKTLCASIREKYDQPWVLSKILELNVDGEEWDDSEEDTNLDEVLPPNDQANDEEFITKNLHILSMPWIRRSHISKERT
jgi:hypothetical protein